MQYNEIESLLKEILVEHRKKINDDKRYLGLLNEENDAIPVISNGIEKTSPAYAFNDNTEILSNDFHKLNLSSEKITPNPITPQSQIGIEEHEVELVTESHLSPLIDHNDYKNDLITNEIQTQTQTPTTTSSAVQTDLQNILIDLVQISPPSKSPPKTPNYNRTKLMDDIRPIFTSSSNQGNLLVHLGDVRKKIKKN